MQIEINHDKTITILEPNLVIRNGKLFNTDTNEYEAINGDKVEFSTTDCKGNHFWISGIVQGYTCNRRIQLKGSAELYACDSNVKKIITHRAIITRISYADNEKEKENEDEFELILKGV